MGPYKIDFESLPWEMPVVGLKFKAHEQGGRKLRLVEFGREFVERDWCTKGHIGYILQGRMEIDFDGTVIMFGPGDGLFIPAGAEHRHKGRVLTDAVKMVVVEDD